MHSTPSALPDHLGYWLRKLSNAVSSSFAARLTRHEISVPQWVILRILYDQISMPLKDIAAQVEVDQGSLSRTVERLAARNLVQRATDPTDRRAVAISLTEAGRELVPKLATEADGNDQAFFGGLSPGQKDEFLATIHRLLKQNSSDRRSPVE